jgi:P27 family predicted phage terminase small subunit
MARIPNSVDESLSRGPPRAGKLARSGAVKSGAPTMPTWLPEAARKEFRRVAAVLKTAGLLSPIDLGILVSYCLAVAEVIDCTERLVAEGLTIKTHGQVIPHPLLKPRAAAEQRVRSLAMELGLTPVSRKRARVETGTPDSKSGVPVRNRHPSIYKPG